MSQKKLKKLKKVWEKTENKQILMGQVEKSAGVREIFRKNWWFLALLLATIFGLYFNALRADFVSDDYATLSQNPRVAEYSALGRNIVSSSYLANTTIAKLFGVTPLPYHLFSLSLYMVIVVLSYILAYKLFGRGIAIAGTLLFAVHPMHVEAVSWISGKPYLFIGFYLVILMLLFVKFLETKKWIWLLVMLLVFLEAFLTDNPRPFSIFLLMPLILILKGYRIQKEVLVKIGGFVLAALIVFLFIAWPNINARISAVNGGINNSGSIFYNPFFQYPTGIAKYLQLMLVPVDLTLYHTMYVFPLWLNWAILLTYLGLIIYFFYKDKRIFFSLSFILVTILPSMAPIKVSWLVAERYGFLPSWGWSIFMAIIAVAIWQQRKIAGAILVGVISIVYGARLVARNVDWQTNHNLWVNTCQVSPNSHNAWNNIGDDYDKLKDYPNAVKGFTQSVLVKPNYADAYHNRANILFKTGRLDLAREMYETGLRFSPGLYQSYISLIQIDLMEKRMEDALRHLDGLIKVEPNNPQSWYIAAIVFDNIGDKAKALESVKRSLSINPDFAPAKEIYIKLNQDNGTSSGS